MTPIQVFGTIVGALLVAAAIAGLAFGHRVYLRNRRRTRNAQLRNLDRGDK